MATPPSLTSTLQSRVLQALAGNGGWLGFERFMELALYTPGLGYYARDDAIFGTSPSGADGHGSDFVTAPEMTPYFARTLALPLAQALQATGTREIWEFGAGSGALAAQLLQALGDQVQRYTIVDLSGALQQRQRDALAAFGAKVRWVSELPPAMRGVVVGNEVLDAMPVKLLLRKGGVWHERGVAAGYAGALVWRDMLTDLRPPLEIAGEHDYLTEVHLHAEAFMRTLAQRLLQGAAFFIDYGFPEREYYHVQRAMGTVMCHRDHRMDALPLDDVGQKDITAHVNFTGLALAAQDAGLGVGGLEVLGYTSQARFLLNCGLPGLLEHASVQDQVMAHKLVMEHEMGELFKVLALCKGAPWDAIGFSQGDRTHTL